MKRESYSWTIFGVKNSGGSCRVRGDASMLGEELRVLSKTGLSKLQRRDVVASKRVGGDSAGHFYTVFLM